MLAISLRFSHDEAKLNHRGSIWQVMVLQKVFDIKLVFLFVQLSGDDDLVRRAQQFYEGAALNHSR
jgi:hypothetical protein